MEWFARFKQHVAGGEEIDLLEFTREHDTEVCERIAARHGMTFRSDPEHETAFLRKPPSTGS